MLLNKPISTIHRFLKITGCSFSPHRQLPLESRIGRFELFMNCGASFTCTLLSLFHYSDIIMSVIASEITRISMVYSTVGSGADQRKHEISASLAFVRGIHRWPITRKLLTSPYAKFICQWMIQMLGIYNVTSGVTSLRRTMDCMLPYSLCCAFIDNLSSDIDGWTSFKTTKSK